MTFWEALVILGLVFSKSQSPGFPSSYELLNTLLINSLYLLFVSESTHILIVSGTHILKRLIGLVR